MSSVRFVVQIKRLPGPRLHTSPATLMASCETARFLASILNKMTDRLAILCTSATNTRAAESTVVKGLSRIDMDEVKADLDAIMGSIEMLKPNACNDTIHCAKEILLKSTAPDPDDEVLQDTLGHIFLFTPDPDGLHFQSLAHDDLTFHIICPAGVPRKDQASIHCNGWKLRWLSGKEAQVVSKKKDLDPTSVTNRLRILISQARSGKLLGNLTELVLEVSAGPDCILEGVMGKVNFAELQLHPGEVLTVLFKLRVRDAVIQGNSPSSTSNQSSGALTNTSEILSQLEKMLAPTDTKILTARLTYKHSMLPEGTTCSVTTECHMKRLPDSAQPILSKFNVPQASECTVLVDQRLAYQLATQGSPRNALQALHKEFGDKFQQSACRDYINLLAKELRYQTRILDRQELAVSPRKQPPMLRTSNSSLTPSAQTSFLDGNHKPQYRSTSEIPTEELFKTEPALTVLSVKESRERLRTDEARRIWGDLRKMKRLGDGEGGKGRSISSPLSEGIRELAVRNQRSLGEETVRSLVFEGGSVGRGVGAPWM